MEWHDYPTMLAAAYRADDGARYLELTAEMEAVAATDGERAEAIGHRAAFLAQNQQEFVRAQVLLENAYRLAAGNDAQRAKLLVEMVHVAQLAGSVQEGLAAARRFEDVARNCPAAEQWRPMLLVNVGLLHELADRHRDALDAFERASTGSSCAPGDGANCNLTNAKLGAGNALRHLGNLDMAMVRYKEAFDVAPDSRRAFAAARLAQALAELGLPHEQWVTAAGDWIEQTTRPAYVATVLALAAMAAALHAGAVSAAREALETARDQAVRARSACLAHEVALYGRRLVA